MGNVRDPFPREVFAATDTGSFLCTMESGAMIPWCMDMTLLMIKKPCTEVTKQLDLRILVIFHYYLYSILLFSRTLYKTIPFDPFENPVVVILHMTHASGCSDFPECCCFLVNLLNGL